MPQIFEDFKESGVRLIDEQIDGEIEVGKENDDNEGEFYQTITKPKPGYLTQVTTTVMQIFQTKITNPKKSNQQKAKKRKKVTKQLKKMLKSPKRNG